MAQTAHKYEKLPPALREMDLKAEAESYLKDLTGAGTRLEIEFISPTGRPSIVYTSVPHEEWMEVFDPFEDDVPEPDVTEQLKKYQAVFDPDPDPEAGFEGNLVWQEFHWIKGSRFGETYLHDSLGWPHRLTRNNHRGSVARYYM